MLADCAALAAALGRGRCRSASGCASSSTSTAGRRAPTRSTGAVSIWPAAIGAPQRRRSRPTCGRRRSPRPASARAGLLVVPLRGRRDGRERVPRRRRRPVRRRATGEAIVLGAPPVEAVASGRALARAAGLERAEDVLADPAHARARRRRAAAALAGVLAVLANALDPALIVLGGGLGRRAGFRERVERGVPAAARVPAPCPRSALVGSAVARTAAWSARRSGGGRRGIGWRRARRDRPLARPEGAARVARGNARGDATALSDVAALLGGEACAVSSRAATAPRTTSASRSGSPRSRGAAGPEVVAVPERPARARRVRLAAGRRPARRLVVRRISRPRRGDRRRLHRRRTRRSPRTRARRSARGPSARALVTVPNQRAVTHTQAFCGTVAAALAVWAEVTSDSGPRRRRCAGCRRSSSASVAGRHGRWVDELGGARPRIAIVFGSGPAWAAALEAALLLKEVAGIPAEGVETREGATSAMMALRPGASRSACRQAPTTRCSPRPRRSAPGRGQPCSERRAARRPTDGSPRCRRSPPRPRSRARLGLARGLDVDRARLDGRLLPRRAAPGMSLGLGVIGCGSVFAGPYRGMIERLRAAGRVHVSAVYDVDDAKRRGAAAHYDLEPDLHGPEPMSSRPTASTSCSS